MKSFQLFMESALQAAERLQLDEAAGDAAAFKERQKARQSAVVSTAKSKASKYRTHGVRGTDKKARKRMARGNRELARAAGQLGSAAIDVAKAGVSKVRSMLKKKDADA